ncbi:hypothetical protein ZWY2020_053831, partial [Hordeum vulgare]
QQADKAASPADDGIHEELPASAQNGRPGSEPAAAPELEDQLEVGDILERHDLKSVFAFDVASRARGVAIHSTPRNGRSLLPYAADSTIFLDGEPKSTRSSTQRGSLPLWLQQTPQLWSRMRRSTSSHFDLRRRVRGCGG